MHDLFPKQLSYNRFVELESRVAVVMMLFLQMFCFGRYTVLASMTVHTFRMPTTSA